MQLLGATTGASPPTDVGHVDLFRSQKGTTTALSRTPELSTGKAPKHADSAPMKANHRNVCIHYSLLDEFAHHL